MNPERLARHLIPLWEGDCSSGYLCIELVSLILGAPEGLFPTCPDVFEIEGFLEDLDPAQRRKILDSDPHRDARILVLPCDWNLDEIVRRGIIPLVRDLYLGVMDVPWELGEDLVDLSTCSKLSSELRFEVETLLISLESFHSKE